MAAVSYPDLFTDVGTATEVPDAGDTVFTSVLSDIISNTGATTRTQSRDTGEASAPGMEGYWHVFARSERCTGCDASINGKPGFLVCTFPCGHAKCQKCIGYEDIFPTNGKLVCPLESCDWTPELLESHVPGTGDDTGGTVSSRPITRPVELLARNARKAAEDMQREIDAKEAGRTSATAHMNDFDALSYRIEQQWNKDSDSVLSVPKWLKLLRPYGKMGLDAAKRDRSFDTLKELEVTMQQKRDIEASISEAAPNAKERFGAILTGVRRLVIADEEGEVGEADDQEPDAASGTETPVPPVRAWFACEGVEKRLSLDVFVDKGINVADLRFGLRVAPEELAHLGLGAKHMSSRGTQSNMEDAKAPFQMGYRVATMRGLWTLSHDEFTESGLTLKAAMDHGYAVEDLVAAGFTFDSMLVEGFLFSDFKRLNVSPAGAMRLGLTRTVFEQINPADAEISDAGWAPEDIRRTYEVSDDWFRKHGISYSTGTELLPPGDIMARLNESRAKATAKRRKTHNVPLRGRTESGHPDRERSRPRRRQSKLGPDSGDSDDGVLGFLDSDDDEEEEEEEEAVSESPQPRRSGHRRGLTKGERDIVDAMEALNVRW